MDADARNEQLSDVMYHRGQCNTALFAHDWTD